MIASLGKEDQVGDIEAIFHEKQTQFKKKNIFVLNDILAKEPDDKLDKENEKKQKADKFAINADEISSMSSVDSDNELWDSIETKRLKSFGFARSHKDRSESASVISGGILQRKRESKMSQIEIGSQIGQDVSEIAADNRALQERYEKKMDKMRENHRLEIHTISNSIQNKAKEMVTAKVEEIKLKFEADVRNLMQQYVETKTQLDEKDNQIQQLNELMRQQERTLNAFRRQAEKGSIGGDFVDTKFTSAGEYLNQTDDDDIHPLVLRNQIENLNAEVKSLKSVCNVYKRDEEKKDQDLKATKKELSELDHKHKYEMEMMKSDYEHKLKVAKQEFEDLEEQFKKYKTNSELELQILQSLCGRYRENQEEVKVQLLAQKRAYAQLDRLTVSHGGTKGTIKTQSQRRPSHMRSSSNNKVPSRESKASGIRKESVSSEHDLSNTSELPQIPESRGSMRPGSVQNYGPPSRDAKRVKIPGGEPGSTFYSNDPNRSSVLTPGSTKYGSFMTRPTTAIEKGKLNSSMGFTDSGGENFNPNNQSSLL